MGPGVLEEILQDFNVPKHPDLLVGIETRDDAGVFRLNEELALIQTIDFFTPMVDDPFVFGQIAAANAINDVYAMGGKPLLAMNLVCYPQCGDMNVLRQILGGGLTKIKEAGALLVGGHTVDDNEPKYGLSVSGLVHPEKVIDNSGACKGDLLFLTKPLGNGIISTAIKAEMASRESYDEAIKWMSMLNREACEVMQEVGINAATDITGFGLVGHLYEMAKGSNVQVEIYADKVRFMTGALEYADLGLIPGGAYSNRNYLVEKINYVEEIDTTLSDLLFSPETAGGLLISVNESKAHDLIKAMENRKSTCFMIGRVLSDNKKGIIIKKI
jgi:selenide,water dikinase